MELEIDFTKSAQENANEYYKRSKRLLQKKKGAEKAIKDLEEKLEEARKNAKKEPERRLIKSVKREWYERFHWFFTSNGMLAIGGRDAHQNELLNSRYFEDKDLFFHADIFGAPVFILKDGSAADRATREEVAEFAACYSSAWKEGLRTIDVYAMKRNQVSKSSSKGSLGTGSFLLSGERDWYRSMQLSLVMLVKEGKLHTIPKATFEKEKTEGMQLVKVTQGNYRKSDAAKKIAAKLGYSDIDAIMRQLPTGSFRIE
jgi:predicted ribosome quality control (RQC) complex YloA/Tae2 family protein